MDVAYYDLVFEGFKAKQDKSSLPARLNRLLELSDAQLNRIRSGKITLLKRKLARDEILPLAKALTQSGLIVKALPRMDKQQQSPEAIRQLLRDGALEDAFAHRFVHEKEIIDTWISLLLLAALPLLTYLLLPALAIWLLLPLANANTWVTQFLPALGQTLIALCCLAPAFWLRPLRAERDDQLRLSAKDEPLLFAFCHGLSRYLSGPQLNSITVVDEPVLRIEQSPLAWLRGEATLVLGTPLLSGFSMTQLAGLLSLRLTPLTSHLHKRSWGLFLLWYNALRLRCKPCALLLNSWIDPLHSHQGERGFAIAKTIVGYDEARRLQKLDNRCNELYQDWPEFMDYCHKLGIAGHDWQSLFITQNNPLNKDETAPSDALFSLTAPAPWLLTNSKQLEQQVALNTKNRLIRQSGKRLWQQFQSYLPLAEQFSLRLIQPTSLIPPTNAPVTRGKANPMLLAQQAARVRTLRQKQVTQALSPKGRRRKAPTLTKAITRWRETSALFWPQGYQNHRLLPLAKALYFALQLVQEMGLWCTEDNGVAADKRDLRDRQLVLQFQKWLSRAEKLPRLALLGDQGKTLSQQLQQVFGDKNLRDWSAQDIRKHQSYIETLMTIYWTFVVGHIFSNEIDPG